MFDRIAPTYDLLNHLLSANVDAAWRRRTVERLALTGRERCLDACTGTGDLALALARGGAIDGVRIVAAPLLQEAVVEHACGLDRVLGRPSRFALGFQLTQPERALGPNPGAFGHFGAGGSLGLCDPEADVAFGYVMNDMGPRFQNPRNRALIDAVYACL